MIVAGGGTWIAAAGDGCTGGTSAALGIAEGDGGGDTGGTAARAIGSTPEAAVICEVGAPPAAQYTEVTHPLCSVKYELSLSWISRG